MEKKNQIILVCDLNVLQVQKLRSELQRVESTTDSEKASLNRNIHELKTRFEALSKQATLDRQLNQQIRDLSQELQALSTTSSAETKRLRHEVKTLSTDLESEKHTSSTKLQQVSSKMQDLAHNSSAQEAKLKEQLKKVTAEFEQLQKTAASEKNAMAAQMQQMVVQMEKTTRLTALTMDNLNNEIRVLSATASSEKLDLQTEIEDIKTNNNWLKLEVQHAMTQLKQLVSKRFSAYPHAVSFFLVFQEQPKKFLIIVITEIETYHYSDP